MDAMRAARRHIAAITPVVIAALLLTGCTVRIIDPSADEVRSPAPQEAGPPPQDETTPRATSSPDEGTEAAPPALSAPNAAERERLIAAATITMTCPSGPLDHDGAVVRVEGSCASLVIDIDAGVTLGHQWVLQHLCCLSGPQPRQSQ